MIELKTEFMRRTTTASGRCVQCFLGGVYVDYWSKNLERLPRSLVEKACDQELDKWIAEEQEQVPLTKAEIAALRELLKKGGE